MKICGTCQQSLPLTEYHKNKSSKDGLRSQCKTCHKVKREAWADKPENKAKAVTYTMRYRKANPEVPRKASRAWQLRNPEACSAQRARRRLRIKHAMTELDKRKSIAYRKRIANDPCFYCGERKKEMEVDHVYPLSRGGTDHWWNLVQSCRDCNRSKWKKLNSERSS